MMGAVSNIAMQVTKAALGLTFANQQLGIFLDKAGLCAFCLKYN